MTTWSSFTVECCILLEVVNGTFADHLHQERGDDVGLDVLDLENLFAVLLVHCSHLGEAGQHFRVQHAGGAEETPATES